MGGLMLDPPFSCLSDIYIHTREGFMRGSEVEVFEGKTFSELLSDIYHTSVNQREEIVGLIETMSKTMTTSVDVINIAPIIQQYLEVAVKNDDQLTKIAAIVQRIISAEQNASTQNSELLSEAEKEQLIRNAGKELQQEALEIHKAVEELPKK
jgi:hypothetical protein